MLVFDGIPTSIDRFYFVFLSFYIFLSYNRGSCEVFYFYCHISISCDHRILELEEILQTPKTPPFVHSVLRFLLLLLTK